MMRKIAMVIGGLIGVVIIIAGVLIVIGFVIDASSKVCSLPGVSKVVRDQVDSEMRGKSAAATLGARAGVGLGNWITGSHDKLPTVTIVGEIVSTTTVTSDGKVASCTAIVAITESTDGVVSKTDRKQIHYSLQKDDSGTWIVSVNTDGLW
jgi:hypothetical protein